MLDVRICSEYSFIFLFIFALVKQISGRPGLSGVVDRRHSGAPAAVRVGHAQLLSGLLLILGAQLAGDWLYQYGFKEIYMRLDAVPSPICGE
ncbi:MAG: hypothetical protein AAF460_14915, partial [Pseudomonadota bacterium]